MKAEVKYRVNMENHVELGTVVPLSQPFVLLIDPSNLCNFKCKFCPTGNKELIKSTGRYNGLLNFDLYKKIIDDLKDFNEPIKTLRLYKEGEPLVNPNFAEMIKYARQSGLVKRIDTTSNGALLNQKVNRAIVDAGLDQINISVNGVSSEQLEFYTNAKVDFEDYVANIKDLYEHRGNCEISIKSIAENLTKDEQKKFFDTFGEISNRIVLEHLSPAWPNFEFNHDVEMKFNTGNYGQDIVDRKVCPYIFYIMVVNADGRVSSCVGDWPNKNIMGDLHSSSVKEIWNGEILNSYRREHLTGHRDNNSFCGVCEVVKYGTLDNLDKYADEILARLDK